MTDEQTLVLNSGHPLGLFPAPTTGEPRLRIMFSSSLSQIFFLFFFHSAPRLVIANGMVIPNYSSRELYDKMFALGVTM